MCLFLPTSGSNKHSSYKSQSTIRLKPTPSKVRHAQPITTASLKLHQNRPPSISLKLPLPTFSSPPPTNQVSHLPSDLLIWQTLLSQQQQQQALTSAPSPNQQTTSSTLHGSSTINPGVNMPRATSSTMNLFGQNIQAYNLGAASNGYNPTRRRSSDIFFEGLDSIVRFGRRLSAVCARRGSHHRSGSCSHCQYDYMSHSRSPGNNYGHSHGHSHSHSSSSEIANRALEAEKQARKQGGQIVRMDERLMGLERERDGRDLERTIERGVERGVRAAGGARGYERGERNGFDQIWRLRDGVGERYGDFIEARRRSSLFNDPSPMARMLKGWNKTEAEKDMLMREMRQGGGPRGIEYTGRC